VELGGELHLVRQHHVVLQGGVQHLLHGAPVRLSPQRPHAPTLCHHLARTLSPVLDGEHWLRDWRLLLAMAVLLLLPAVAEGRLARCELLLDAITGAVTQVVVGRGVGQPALRAVVARYGVDHLAPGVRALPGTRRKLLAGGVGKC